MPSAPRTETRTRQITGRFRFQCRVGSFTKSNGGFAALFRSPDAAVTEPTPADVSFPVLGGVDVVAYWGLSEGAEPVSGTPALMALYGDYRFYFSSIENLRTFEVLESEAVTGALLFFFPSAGGAGGGASTAAVSCEATPPPLPAEKYQTLFFYCNRSSAKIRHVLEKPLLDKIPCRSLARVQRQPSCVL